MRKFLVVAWILLSQIICTAYAEGDSSIIEEYMRLRNTDPRVTKVADWVRVSKSLAELGENAKDPVGIATYEFRAGVGFDILYRATKSREYFQLARHSYRNVYEKASKHELADDALLKDADLASLDGDTGEARELLKRIIASYSGTDSAVAARARLEKEEEPSWFGRLFGRHKEKKEEAAPPVVATRSGFTVVLDPGHGGEDRGAEGIGGILEKDVTLSIALEAKRILKSENTNVILTRVSDLFVPLADRTSIANRANADLFISIHTNASPNGDLQGLEVYYLDNTDDAASQALADRENSSDKAGSGGDLQFMLSDLIQSAKIDSSVRLAHTVQDTVSKGIERGGWKLLGKSQVRKAPFYVLVGAHMPCVLAELLYINNEKEGVMLGDEAFRRNLAAGLVQAVNKFLRKKR